MKGNVYTWPAVLAVALAAACSKEPAPASSAAPLASAPSASSARTPWVKARAADEVAMLEAPATVLATPESNAGVSPPFRARVVRVLARPGERVKRGEPLAEVVMPEVVQAAGAYASAATRVEAYGRRKTQLDGLKKEGMVRLTDLLEVDTKLAEARADRTGALAMLRAAGLDAGDAARILAGGGKVVLRSPIDGVVTQVKASIGEQRESSGEPLVRIAGEGDPRVEARLARVVPGPAAYELWLGTGEHHPLRLVGQAPQMDARDGTTLVWFAARDGTRLVQGQTGKVKIRLAESAKLASVPARAVGLGPEGAHVVVRGAAGGAPARVNVEVLAASGSEALVRGVDPGEEVAADAALAEVPASAVQPAPGTTPPAAPGAERR